MGLSLSFLWSSPWRSALTLGFTRRSNGSPWRSALTLGFTRRSNGSPWRSALTLGFTRRSNGSPWRSALTLGFTRRSNGLLVHNAFGLPALILAFGLSACATTNLPAPRPRGTPRVSRARRSYCRRISTSCSGSTSNVPNNCGSVSQRYSCCAFCSITGFSRPMTPRTTCLSVSICWRAPTGFGLPVAPHATGCRDPVVLLRGDYNRYPLRKRLSHTNPGLDLGGGWLRYDRELNLGRSGLRRIYFAPPDRLLLVSTTELDAVERALERSRGSRDQVPKENGTRVTARAPDGDCAAPRKSFVPLPPRWLRDARSLELQILPEPSTLKLVVTIGFESQQRAERASVAFRVLWSVLAPRRTSPIPVEVVGDSLVVSVELSAPSPGTVPAELDPRRRRIVGPIAARICRISTNRRHLEADMPPECTRTNTFRCAPPISV